LQLLLILTPRGAGALSIIVCYVHVCAAVKTPVFSPKDPFQGIMISVETKIFTLFPFRRPPFLPQPVPVHREFGDPRPERFGGNRRDAPLISPPLHVKQRMVLSRARDTTRPIMPCNARGRLIGSLCILARTTMPTLVPDTSYSLYT